MEVNELLNNYHEEFGDEDYLVNVETYFTGYIAFILPIEDEDISYATITTLGVSKLLAGNNCEPAEFILEIEDDLSEEEGNKFAMELSDFFVKTISAKECFKVGALIPHSVTHIASTPFFYVSPYEGFSSEWIEDSGASIRLLQLALLTSSECEEMKNLHEKIKVIVIKETYKLLRNPQRSSIPLIHSATKNIWDKIENWYSKNTQTLLSSMRPGAASEDLDRLEKNISMGLPRDYYHSLSIHNGNMSFYNSYHYLRVDEVYDVWKRMKGINDRGVFARTPKSNDDKITNTWWNEQWIPFAEDSAGNLICIDLNPGTKGIIGQIIYWEKEEGPLVTEFVSFIDWLHYYLRGLFEGVYKQVEGGFLED